MPMSRSLDAIRRTFTTPLMLGQWALVPVTVFAAWFSGHPAMMAVAAISAVLAGTAAASWFYDRIGLSTRITSTVALCGQIALLVFACQGTRYQIDMHMAFFTTLAITTAWCCWRSILVATAVVAVHHLILNFVYPLAVFPDGAEFARVVVHAVILLAEAGALVWLALRLEAALQGADAATDVAIANQGRESDVRKEASLAEAQRAVVEEQVLVAVGAVVEAAKRGDFSVRTAQASELGRLGSLVQGVDELASACEGFLDETDRALAALAAGDLTARMDTHFGGRLAAVAGNFNRSTEALADALAAVAQSASATQRAADEILSATHDLSGRGESQASSLEETSAVIQGIAMTTRQTVVMVSEAAQKARDTADDADAGVIIAGRAVEAIDRVDEQAKRIVDIVGVMDGLAFQTNLLALNASVEAARAGEGGRGFAVVATEVRRLAQQSADAARDVRALISETKMHVEEGVKLVREAGANLTAVSGEAGAVARVFEEISHATREQSQGVGEVERALRQMDSLTQDNARAAAHAAAAGSGMAETAKALAQLTARFRLAGGDVQIARTPARRAA
jgi:methyl-accepting chemotaxis protein